MILALSCRARHVALWVARHGPWTCAWHDRVTDQVGPDYDGPNFFFILFFFLFFYCWSTLDAPKGGLMIGVPNHIMARVFLSRATSERGTGKREEMSAFSLSLFLVKLSKYSYANLKLFWFRVDRLKPYELRIQTRLKIKIKITD